MVASKFTCRGGDVAHWRRQLGSYHARPEKGSLRSLQRRSSRGRAALPKRTQLLTLLVLGLVVGASLAGAATTMQDRTVAYKNQRDLGAATDAAVACVQKPWSQEVEAQVETFVKHQETLTRGAPDVCPSTWVDAYAPGNPIVELNHYGSRTSLIQLPNGSVCALPLQAEQVYAEMPPHRIEVEAGSEHFALSLHANCDPSIQPSLCDKYGKIDSEFTLIRGEPGHLGTIAGFYPDTGLSDKARKKVKKGGLCYRCCTLGFHRTCRGRSLPGFQ